MPGKLIITPLLGFPLVNPGDALPDLIIHAMRSTGVDWLDNDILVIAQKIVSKSENRLVHLSSINPSKRADEIGKITGKDPRFIELVLSESQEVLRMRMGTIIVQHKLGFICANAGIDHSNVTSSDLDPEGWYLLLPQNPDESARIIREKIEQITQKRIGVMIIDSHGRAWRQGIVGTTIGFSGLPGLVDLRGTSDLFGYQLRITQIAAVDELAAGASLMIGQAAEGTPVAHVRGFPYPLQEGNFKELIRPKKDDLFR